MTSFMFSFFVITVCVINRFIINISLSLRGSRAHVALPLLTACNMEAHTYSTETSVFSRQGSIYLQSLSE